MYLYTQHKYNSEASSFSDQGCNQRTDQKLTHLHLSIHLEGTDSSGLFLFYTPSQRPLAAGKTTFNLLHLASAPQHLESACWMDMCCCCCCCCCSCVIHSVCKLFSWIWVSVPLLCLFLSLAGGGSINTVPLTGLALSTPPDWTGPREQCSENTGPYRDTGGQSRAHIQSPSVSTPREQLKEASLTLAQVHICAYSTHPIMSWVLVDWGSGATPWESHSSEDCVCVSLS